MPTYEYACTSCGEHLEVVQSFSDAPLTECPNCAGTLRKVFGSIGIVLKGSGFYRNDSRSAGANGKGKARDKAPAGSGSSDAAGSGSSGSGSSGDGTSTGSSSAPSPASGSSAAAAGSSGT